MPIKQKWPSDVSHKCKRCGVEFFAHPSVKRKYCSIDCARATRVESHRCRFCGDELQRRKRDDGEGYLYRRTCGSQECKSKLSAASKAASKAGIERARLIKQYGQEWVDHAAKMASKRPSRVKSVWEQRAESTIRALRSRRSVKPSTKSRRRSPQVQTWQEAEFKQANPWAMAVDRWSWGEWEMKADSTARNWRRKAT